MMIPTTSWPFHCKIFTIRLLRLYDQHDDAICLVFMRLVLASRRSFIPKGATISICYEICNHCISKKVPSEAQRENQELEGDRGVIQRLFRR